MPVFDELLESKMLEDPEERKAEELRRGKKKWGRKVSVKETSVSAKRYLYMMRFMGFAVAVVVISIVVFFVYKGISLFIS